MLRCLLLAVISAVVSAPTFGCECIDRERPCQNLGSDAIFVGRVLETVAVKHAMEKNSWTLGYSMRFVVEESLAGGLGLEVSVETGSGGGDCGTPLPPGKRFLVFAYKGKDGQLWTGMCNGNREIGGNYREDSTVLEYRNLVRSRVGSIFGRLTFVKPRWEEDDVNDETPKSPMEGLVVSARSAGSESQTRTAKDGSYQFQGLPAGDYVVVPSIGKKQDYDHEYEDNYKPHLSAGQCVNVSFRIEPSTRIRGHLIFPAGYKSRVTEVVAIPTNLKNLNQFSGKWDFTGEQNDFDLWPLPPGDYYVGVNINSSPKADAPFPPTYYPGVRTPKEAKIVRLREGEVQQLELRLPEIAKTRSVHFVAIGLDGKPLRAIYIQLEDLRHPGDASSYVNVDLDENGAGTLTIYAGYSYHLHGSHWVSNGNDWCAKPIAVAAGSEPVETRFVIDRSASGCEIGNIDKLKL